MIDPLQAILQPTLPALPQYPITSRYYGIDTAMWTRPDGEQVNYLRRRFLPDPATLQLLQYYTVRQGERLDNITARMLGDPLQFWRIADANNAMRPNELTEAIGRQLRITLPAGVAGPVL